MTDTEVPEDGELKVQITLWPHDSGEKGLREIGLGLTPFILIEVDLDEETGDTTFSFNGSWIDDHQELIETLESSLEVLRAAVEQNAEATS